ncbi:hypothetical protein CAOG_06947 [Capsaspora owczarzaki ATCC 30864]|uniref:Uncharacterized protein n=1 Tax=Capsaspora owczarzaki (strain ATCC 30864) TaxID=595528 RepID=A0A0D2VY89_CAPO3|nr:hypothetical protein CAOG_06947 [Capsaspora owczarzaki ATCC 30864]KJE96657.1 hypothetical protein CAOG_006947 [Capsaspora owczarzaki ATCC 30864]|eukprot:XP_004343671.1 hypothetical protein CAOG_06947 [Capsaspora owczarzaki ATCC 30864]
MDHRAELKRARKLLSSDPAEAVQCCRDILNDKTLPVPQDAQYTALVFLGAALEATAAAAAAAGSAAAGSAAAGSTGAMQEAEQSYRRAAALQPRNPLAWQGLDKLLTKQSQSQQGQQGQGQGQGASGAPMLAVLAQLTLAFLAANDLAKAVDAFNRLVSQSLASGNWQAAFDLVAQLVPLPPSSSAAPSTSAPSPSQETAVLPVALLEKAAADLMVLWLGAPKPLGTTPAPAIPTLEQVAFYLQPATVNPETAANLDYHRALVTYLREARCTALGAAWSQPSSSNSQQTSNSITSQLAQAVKHLLAQSPEDALAGEVSLVLSFGQAHRELVGLAAMDTPSPSCAEARTSWSQLVAHHPTSLAGKAASLLLLDPFQPPLQPLAELWESPLTPKSWLPLALLTSRAQLASGDGTAAIETAKGVLGQCTPGSWLPTSSSSAPPRPTSASATASTAAAPRLPAGFRISASTSTAPAAAVVPSTFANEQPAHVVAAYRHALELVLAEAYLLIQDDALRAKTLELCASVESFVNAPAIQQSSSPAAPLSLQALLVRGELHMVAADYPAAAATFNKVLAAVPLHARGQAALAWSLVQQAKTLPPASWSHPQPLTTAQSLLEAAVAARPSDSQLQFRLALCLWAVADQTKDSNPAPIYDRVYSHLLAAARFNAADAEIFAQLGLLLLTVRKQPESAKKCLLKAVGLNPLHEAAASQLSDLYTVDIRAAWQQRTEKLQTLSETDSVVTALQVQETALRQAALELHTNVANAAGVGRAPWAWLRRGIELFALGQFSDAVVSLQSALRGDSKNSAAWRCLADTYIAQGKYIASLRAFQRSLELEPSAVYAMLQIGRIHLMLGASDTAIAQYLGAVDAARPTHWFVPALKGLAEALLTSAQQCVAVGRVGKAADHLLHALHVLNDAPLAHNNAPLLSLAKLRGDIILQFAGLPVSECIGVDCTTWTRARGTPRDAAAVQATLASASALAAAVASKEAILQCAVSVFASITNACASDDSAFADLAVALYRVYANRRGFSHVQLAASPSSSELIDRALTAAGRALTLQPGSPVYWNIAGALYMALGKAQQAQHALLTSIKLEHTNPAAWTNLGLLYTHLSVLEPANFAFKAVQAIQPSYSPAWIGQSLVAERFGMEEEAGDLLRHASELDQNPEADAGYANYAYRFHNSAKVTAARAPLSLATTALGRYVARETHNAAARNLYGALLELQGLYAAAADEFATAQLILALQSTEASADCLPKVIANHARVLVRLDRLAEGQALFDRLGAAPVDAFVLASRARLLFEACQWANSAAVYAQALDAAVSSKQLQLACTCTVALALCSYRLGDVPAARNHLFRCLQIDSGFQSALLLMSALGLLHNDFTLAQAGLNDFGRIAPNLQAEAEICSAGFLHACLSLLQGDAAASKGFLSRLVFFFPHRPQLWTSLANFLVEYDKSAAASASHFALSPRGQPIHVSSAIVACARHGCKNTESTSNRVAGGSSALAGPWLNREAHFALVQTGRDGNSTLASPTVLAEALLVSGRSTHRGHIQDPLRDALAAAQMAVHTNPSNLVAWADLAAATLAADIAHGYRTAASRETAVGAAAPWHAPPAAIGAKVAKSVDSACEAAVATQSMLSTSAARPVLQHTTQLLKKLRHKVILMRAESLLGAWTSGNRADGDALLDGALQAVNSVLHDAIASQDVATAQLAQRQLARTLLVGGRREFGLGSLKQCVNLNPADLGTWQDLAVEYAASRQFVAAELCLRTALRASAPTDVPRRVAILARLCVIAVRAGKASLAQESEREAARLDGASPLLAFLRGWLASQGTAAADLKAAKRFLQSSVSRSEPPLSPLAAHTLAALLAAPTAQERSADDQALLTDCQQLVVKYSGPGFPFH